jgi:hypothetical protein
VFSEIIDPGACGSGGTPCTGAFASDILAGLERVYSLALSLNVVSVNMSLGGSLFTSNCDNQPYKPVIDNLRSIGVATVVAAGNSGSTNALSSPACISTAVSVGSVDKSNQVSSFSDVASFMSLFAPGSAITSSIPGGGYMSLNGTSMATPHVSGTWAILRQAAPGAGVSLVLDALRQTGLPVTDTRPGGTVTAPRVSIFEALGVLAPLTHAAPTLTSVAPARVRAGASPVVLTLTGTGFDAFSVARWNGVPKTTSVASTTQLMVQIPAADLVGGTVGQVFVTAPSPGGGTSTSLPVIVDPPPSLTVSATSVAPSSKVTVTLANGFGGQFDWLALANVGSPNNVYISFTYVGTGITDKAFTFNMPATAGQYEFRLFVNNGYERVATSPTVTIDPTLSPVPAIASLSPTAIPAGSSPFTLTVNGSGFVASSSVRWNGSPRTTTFVSSSQLQASITASDVASTGSVPVTVFTPAPGGGTSSPVTFTINAPSTLTVSATTASPGGSVTATLTNGTGGATDWIAFASTSAPNTSYITYTYVGGGVTTRTWTVTMPSTPGTYEFRYFPNGGYNRTATSPTITVQAGPSPTPIATALSPSSVPPGSGAFTLTVVGSGFGPSSIVRWNGGDRATTFISASELRAAIAAGDVVSSGSAAVTVFTPPPGGGTSAALTFTIGQGSSAAPELGVSATTVSPGASLTATLTNGPGGSGDWLAFASTSAGNASYIAFTYVGAGVSTRTWTVTAPTTAGTYEFRLFLNNGYTRAATSPTVTVVVGPNPTPALTTLSPARAIVGSSAFTLTVNGSGFVSSSVIRWNGVNRATAFVNSTQLTTSISATDVAALGSAQVTVFSPTPGGGLSNPLTFVIGPPPSLTVSTTTASPGASVTVTLTDGLGGTYDWMAFAATSAPNTAYNAFTYVGAGVTTRTWTLTMPSTPGTYEFRLFPNNGYTRAATSPTITVTVQ